MKRFLKWSGFALLGLVGLAATAAIAGVLLAERKLQRQVRIDVAAVEYRDDAASLERGRYLYASRGCVDCHGADGAGRTFIDDGAMKVSGPHISTGPGSVTAIYQPSDWVRIIRHGVKRRPASAPTAVRSP
jgi:mono/diheme cytochrome c family protein